MDLEKYIRYDHENSMILLTSCIMNIFNQVSKDNKKEYVLYNIPYSLIIDCIDKNAWNYDQSFDGFDYNILIYSEPNLININGNIESGRTEFFG